MTLQEKLKQLTTIELPDTDINMSALSVQAKRYEAYRQLINDFATSITLDNPVLFDETARKYRAFYKSLAAHEGCCRPSAIAYRAWERRFNDLQDRSGLNDLYLGAAVSKLQAARDAAAKLEPEVNDRTAAAKAFREQLQELSNSEPVVYGGIE